MQAIISLIQNAGNIEEVANTPLERRVPFLEFQMHDMPPMMDIIEEIPPPRLLKTHLPARFFMQHQNLLNKKTKVIYCLRNPKDTLVSYYNFFRMNECCGLYKGTWSEFFHLFKEDKLPFGNFFDMILEWWQYRNTYNIHFVKYEDTKRDPISQIKSLAEFLDVDLTADQVHLIAEKTRFKNMKHEMKFEIFDDDISPFMRKGEVGDHMNYFTDEENAIMDEMCEKRLKGTGITFDFMLDED